MEGENLLASAIVALGEFGEDIAERIKSVLPKTTILFKTSLEDLNALNSFDVFVLASASPAIEYAETLDMMAFCRLSSFVPISMTDLVITVGPVVCPGRSCCYRCWSVRQAQISEAPFWLQKRRAFYQSQQQREPYGYLPSLNAVAAAITADLIAHAGVRHEFSGRCLDIGPYSRLATRPETMGVDFCDRCGTRRSCDERTFLNMRRTLSPLFKDWKEPEPIV